MSDTQRLPSIDLPPPEMCGQDIIAERYLSLLRICLTRSFREPAYGEIQPSSRTLFKALRYTGYSAVHEFCALLIWPSFKRIAAPVRQ